MNAIGVVAFFFLAFDAAAAEKPPAKLPEVPAYLTPAEADSFLAKLTDAQARALLARELERRARKSASPDASGEGGFRAWLVGVRDDLASAELGAGRRTDVIAEGAAAFPAAWSAFRQKNFSNDLVWLAIALLGGAMAAFGVRRALRRQGLETEHSRLAAMTLQLVLDALTAGAFGGVAVALAHAAVESGGASADFLFTYVTAAVVAAAGVPLARLLPVFARRSLLVLWTTVLFFGLTLSLIEEVQVPKPVLILATLGAGTLVMLMLVGLVLAARSLLARVASPRHGAILQLFGVAYVLLVWAVWAAGVLDGEPGRIGAAAASFVVVLAFPVLDRWIGRSIDELVGRPAGHDARPGVAAALRWAMRALLAVLLVTAVNELWGFQVFAWQAELRRAVLAASFDLFAAFVVAAAGWQFIRIAIDRRLAAPDASSRLKTLLPLARVLLVAVLIVSTVILVLSGLGVNVGPLLAGAGIVGLAIGFGAQTLVRDIITGAFLILDDAFRVGEYIQSGSYKGTVEAIGLRSVRLRHHRGPIYVVPFGELRGVENLSRDWAIDKITVGVTYDTDIERARKLVKKVGEELAADPELAPDILAPLKMQGLDAFGDFALELRMKITTRPGEKRFVIRRRAYAMIKKAFDANGIRFAYPTVQLAGAAAPAQAAAAAAATRLPALRETA